MERAAHGVRRDALAERQLADPCRGVEERRGLRHARGDQPLDGLHDARQLGHAVHPVGRRVEPLPRRRELADPADRVAALHQRSHVGRAAQPLAEDLGTDVEPDRHAAPVEQPAIARVDDGPAAGRDHPPQVRAGIGRAQRGDGVLLQAPERRLAVGREDLGDPAAGLVLDLVVEIDERRPVARGDPPPDGALPAARQADQDEVHGRSVVPAGAGLAVPVRGGRRGAAGSHAGRGRPPATGGSGAAATRSRVRRRLSSTSAIESPPVFSRTNRARVSMTIASPMTPAAGTTEMSLRS